MNIPDPQAYTPMMQQYLEIKKDYTDFIVFFRLGDFYEMFFTDALVASKELEIVLTGRDAGAPERVPMCGVPHHAAQVYAQKLIDRGYKIAIVEQVEDPQLAKGLVRREVIKIMTPGTLMEEGSVDARTNNYIVALEETKSSWVLAYCDLTTGEVSLLSIPHQEELLESEIANLNAKEVVLSSHAPKHLFRNYLELNELTLSTQDETSIPVSYRSLVSDIYDKDLLTAFGRLVGYLEKTQKRELMHLQKAIVFESRSYLQIDHHSIRNLELIETYRSQSKKGTLLWLMDDCQTAMGSRYLKQTILRPLTDVTKIALRHAFVASMNDHFLIHEELKTHLKEVYDLERIIGRLSFGNANAKDLVHLAKSLSVVPEIRSMMRSLEDPYANSFLSRLHEEVQLQEEIVRAIVENPPLSITDGGFIRFGYDEELDRIKSFHADGKDWLSDFEAQERERTGIKKLRIGYNRVFGYYIEISKGQLELVTDEFGYTRKQTLANSERFVTEELKHREAMILSSQEEAVKLEYELFMKLRELAIQSIVHLQDLARAIAEIDMLSAFSSVAMKEDFVKPEIHELHAIEIVEGKHPVVAKLLEKDIYVQNDVHMSENTDILLITGPNMSGKSTYMRQVALTVILAQMGSFVPAKSARLPIFDRVFTRIGASDDLAGGKSTFMVEMTEVEYALKNATPQSLILFDEIGRGTATYDGMALAQAIIEYAHQKIRCKILFSTHYHELTYLEDELKLLRNVHVVAKEEKGSIVFLHKVVDGPTDQSYGIHVAKLAQMPSGLIRRANEILKELEKNHGYNIIKPQTVDLFNFDQAIEETESLGEYQSIIDQIDAITLEEMTPLASLNLLASIIAEIRRIKRG